MKDEMTYDELEAAVAKLLAMPRPRDYTGGERVNFLVKTFSGKTDDLCRFMGHMRVVLKTKRISKADAVGIFDDIAMAALSVGRDEGRDSAIRDYAGPEFQFLLARRVA